jgi:hypothetical protein
VSDFELYYPARFAEAAAGALSEQNKKRKRERKRELVNEVVDWILADEGAAREQFEVSAAEVIGKLQEIEVDLKALRLGGNSLVPEPAPPSANQQDSD